MRSNKYAYLISFITRRQTGCPLDGKLIPSGAVLDEQLYLKVQEQSNVYNIIFLLGPLKRLTGRKKRLSSNTTFVRICQQARALR